MHTHAQRRQALITIIDYVLSTMQSYNVIMQYLVCAAMGAGYSTSSVNVGYSRLKLYMHLVRPSHSPGRAKMSFFLPSISRVANVVGFLITTTTTMNKMTNSLATIACAAMSEQPNCRVCDTGMPTVSTVIATHAPWLHEDPAKMHFSTNFLQGGLQVFLPHEHAPSRWPSEWSCCYHRSALPVGPGQAQSPVDMQNWALPHTSKYSPTCLHSVPSHDSHSTQTHSHYRCKFHRYVHKKKRSTILYTHSMIE